MALALGVLLISKSGNQVDLMHILFGSVLAVDTASLVLMGLVASVSLIGLAVIYRPLVLEGVDPVFLRSSAGAAACGTSCFSCWWCSIWSRVFNLWAR